MKLTIFTLPTILLLVCSLLSHSSAESKSGIQAIGIGIHTGPAFVAAPGSIEFGDHNPSESFGPSFSIGLSGDLHLPVPLTFSLHFTPSIEVWFNNEELSNINGSFLHKHREIAFNIPTFRLVAASKPDNRFKPYFGLGVGVHLLSTTWEEYLSAGSKKTRSYSEAQFGLNLHGGAELHITDKIIPFGDLKLKLGKPEQLRIALGARFVVK